MPSTIEIMDANILLLQAAGMSKEARIDMLSKMGQSNTAFKIFFAEFLSHEHSASMRPIARPHLLHQQPADEIWADRDLWAWAAAWTLMTMHREGLYELQKVCGLCGQVTGVTCDDCGSPMCNKCYEQKVESRIQVRGNCWKCHMEAERQHRNFKRRISRE